MRGKVHILVYCPIDTFQWGSTHSALVNQKAILLSITYSEILQHNNDIYSVLSFVREHHISILHLNLI